jgi:deoxyribose-phosphate aldolase
MPQNKTEMTGGRIELSLFAPHATGDDIAKLCFEAREQSFFAVCVNGSRIELACALLEDSDLRVVALVGFPLGAADSDAKRLETEIAVDHGAHEIDFVVNLGRLKDGDSKYVLRELRDIVEAADERNVKAVIESHLLTREEKILACGLAGEAGVKFISASTGFHTPATSVEEVKLLHEAAGPEIGVKAWTAPGEAPALLDAGATRIGLPFISRR